MQITEYVSIENQYLLDAQKYIERANKYLEEGKAAHCVGCLAKAAKKLHKYNEYNRVMNSPYIVSIVKPMLDNLQNKIAKSILG